MTSNTVKLGYVYKAGEAMQAGMWVTPDAEGRIFRAKAGDTHLGSMGLLDNVEPGDLDRFEMPRSGLGRKVRAAE